MYMRRTSFFLSFWLAVFLVLGNAAMADPIQFGIIHATGFKAGAPLPEGGGYTSQTIVVANLGTRDFNIDDLAFQSHVISTTTAVNPDVSVFNSGLGLLL